MIDNFVLIIGAMKCGTSSLFSYLGEHPQIAPCRIKEPNFFLTNFEWQKGFEWYQSLWDWNPNEHKIALEASVNYTKIPGLPNAAEKIATVKANFKFIYIMRDPIERIESHYTHRYILGLETTNRPVTDEVDRHFINTSRYANQLEQYYKRFPADSILLLNFEDLKTDPSRVIRKLCQFLDLDLNYEFQGLGTIKHATKRKKVVDPRLSLLKSIQPIRSLATLIPAKQKQMFYSRFFSRRNEEKFQLSPEQRSFILSELQEDLKKLRLEYGFDLSRWQVEV